MKSFCIIGLGRFGKTLAKTLAEEGAQVMVIDEDPDSVAAVADIVTSAVIGDPTNEAVLRTSGVKNYDCAIVSISKKIDDSVLVTLMLKDLGIGWVVARSVSELHTRVLEKIGADQIVFPERDMGEKFAYMLGRENVLDYIEFSDEYSIVEIKVPESWLGKDLIKLDIRRKYNITVIAVRTESGKIDISPGPNRVFRPGDTATLVGMNRDIDNIVRDAK
ncbi:MAG: TrkA family potassium uptake protein [Clostridia bacterium]|nr:TrkA family potassium uptake protein [Clostridia bacterium]MBQ4574730.1 TrkA family potassium uptake protein [Clostridia bacterium]